MVRQSVQALASIIDGDPDTPAVVAFGGGRAPVTLTYGELVSGVDEFARRLVDMGVRPHDRVAIIASNHEHHMTTFLAIGLAGGCACPVSHRLPAQTISQLFDECDIRFAISDDERCGIVPDNVRGVTFDELKTSAGGAAKLPHVDGDDAACVMLTSGSTGHPKAVPITHAGYSWGVRQYADLKPPPGEGRVLISAPLYHMNGQCDFAINLSHGSTTVLMRKFELSEFLSAIEDYQITEIGGVPTMLAMAIGMMKAGRKVNTSSVTSVNLGSAPLSKALYEDIKRHFPNARITNGYGTTETGFVCFGRHPDGLEPPIESVGYPRAVVDMKIDPRNDELCLRTRMMAKGYLNNEAATAERFVDGWYRTGDVVRKDRDGFFYITGRVDDMFVCGGENIFPGEIESRLERHPAVLQAAVIPEVDPVKGQVPAAFVVRAPGKPVTEEELKKFTLAEGPAYAHPRRISFLEAMPLAGTNKIDKAALAKRLQVTD